MIYGTRIRFRAPERQDIPQFVTWLNDPEVRFGLQLHLPMSIAEEENWFDEMLKRPPHERILVIEIQNEEDWRPIGTCGFHIIDWKNRIGELGIAIGEKQFWDKGYGTEAMELLVQHGFETLNLNRIALEVFENNPRAIRTYEKAGFIHEGRKRQAMYKNGNYLDILMMSVLRQDWEKKGGTI